MSLIARQELSEGCQQVLGLVAGLSYWAMETRWIFMLEGYIDDSGSEPTDPVCVLGGFFTTAKLWIEFMQEWNTVLAENPSIGYFKAWEAESRDNEFKGWTVEDRDKKVLALVDVICNPRFELRNIDCVIGWQNYKAATRGRLRFTRTTDNPYFWAYYKTMLLAASYQRVQGIKNKVDFVFDIQGKLGRATRRWHEHFHKMLPKDLQDRIGIDPAFKDDKEVVALQAADLYAWQVHRFTADQFVLKGIPMREPLTRMLELNGPSSQLTRDDLELLVDGLYRRKFPKTYPK